MGIDESIEVTLEQRERVERELRRRDLVPRVRERLEMVKAAAFGQDVGAICLWSGRSPRTVRRWLGEFADRGVEALADAPRSGRPAQATQGYLEALEVAIEAKPHDLGLEFDVWTSDRLSVYLTETTGTKVSPGWLRALLCRQRFRCGRPKHTLHHLQDPGEVARTQAQLREVGRKGGGRARALRAALSG